MNTSAYANLLYITPSSYEFELAFMHGECYLLLDSTRLFVVMCRFIVSFMLCHSCVRKAIICLEYPEKSYFASKINGTILPAKCNFHMISSGNENCSLSQIYLNFKICLKYRKNLFISRGFM